MTYAHREREAERQSQLSASGRDIGPTPPIANVRRRRRCEKSLRLFCETYNPAAFYWGWSDDHLEAIRAIEQSIMLKSCLAFALPRGSGKTTICRMATLWAVSAALVQYTFLIGATAEKARENLDAVKVWMRYLEGYIEDFPEISLAARSLNGIANRASGQTQNRQSTLIRWETDRVVLPRVLKPPNMRWHKGKFAPTAGLVIGVAGLTGEGVRGSLFAHPDGRQVRPDFCLLDDPQTDESANSITQNRSRIGLINGAVLGMAGPGKRIAAVMPCTIIKPGDMVSQVLDRKKSPAWRGIRRQLLRSMPKNMKAWETYFEIYRSCICREVPDRTDANAHYLAHRSELDEGAEASWESRKGEDEVSAIQHAIDLYCERGPDAFWAEYQNAPLEEKTSTAIRIKPDLVLAKCNGRPRGQIPQRARWLSAGIDVHDELLYWHVLATEPGFTPYTIDYGTVPEQPVRYFQQATPPVPLSSRYPGRSKEGVIYAGVEELLRILAEKVYARDDGAKLPIDLILIDCGYKPDEVAKAIRALGRGRQIAPSKGFGIGPHKRPFTEYKPEPGTELGRHWRRAVTKATMLLTVEIDTNRWKSFARDRITALAGESASWSLFGDELRAHQLLGDHFAAEIPVETSGPYGQVEIWSPPPNRPDQHQWDCFVEALVAANVLGAKLPEWERPRAVGKPSAPKREGVSYL